MKPVFVALFAAGLMLPFSSLAQDASLLAPSGAVVDYDPFSGLAGLQDITIELDYTGQVTQDARIVISPDQADSFRLEGSGDPLYFEIDSPLGKSGPNDFNVPISLNPSDTPQQSILTFKIPSGQYADAGDMEVDIKLGIVDSATNELISNEKIITIIGRVPLRAQTNFAGTSAGFENGTTFALVDFGEITPGDTRNLNFQVRGNSDVDISMRSENGGKLINQSSPASSPIDYNVTADGLNSDLSDPLVFMRRPAKSLAGSSYPLSITLENLEQGVFAGSYRDIITIDVTPR